MASSAAEGFAEKFLDIPYDQRWERLKPTIIRIYMEENNKIAHLSRRMKYEYSFDAQIHQYRYHFKKWGTKKRTTAEEKDAVISTLGKRRRLDGVSTSNVLINQGDFEKKVDTKQLQRYINQSIRQREQLTWTPGLFLPYDLPYAALFHRNSGNDNPSPSSVGPVTPSYLNVKSPQGVTSPSASHNALSPAMQLIQKKFLIDRATLFLEGRERDLLAQLSEDERKSTATWLHDFWIYSFMTAKYWGRGPKSWSHSLIKFKSFPEHTVPSTPNRRSLEQTSDSLSPTAIIPQINSPSQLCRWTIHRDDDEYEEITSPPSLPLDESEEKFDVDDESTWSKWSTDESSRNLANTIERGLQENLFTTVQPEQLPLDADSIVKSITKSPDELQTEALGFAIMSRNLNVVEDIVHKNRLACFSTIYPFHLSARFLDGGTTCCTIIEDLLDTLQGKLSIGVNYINGSSLTVLDELFVTIIRSHSLVLPQTLGDAFIGQTRYPGQDVDPCGRWDADSPCIRQLYASGQSTIPSQWKHMFCHTSVQTICHYISTIFAAPWRPNMNTPSGLFLRRCNHCGLQLQIGPLHALVLTAFCLANDGMPGENLFGAVACLVCLLTFRADPCATAEVAVYMLLGHDPEDGCQHSEMNPAQLAVELFSAGDRAWTPELNLGWEVLIAILQHAIAIRQNKPEGDDVETCGQDIHEIEHTIKFKLVYCGDQQLGIIWAAIQAELLTYRRLNEEDPWLSPKFEMELLLRGLKDNDGGYLDRLAGCGGDSEEDRLKPYSRCGFFMGARTSKCALREEACVSYYANLDDWKRTTFIGIMDD
ncbi:hypothetical protein F4781DRAFT_143054 [Annulohypoxylon bovei var. microspora]|nr:hypothetical protein F4781DRAFT_143054 [Annulohypoxylon bovei var. microspora]